MQIDLNQNLTLSGPHLQELGSIIAQNAKNINSQIDTTTPPSVSEILIANIYDFIAGHISQNGELELNAIRERIGNYRELKTEFIPATGSDPHTQNFTQIFEHVGWHPMQLSHAVNATDTSKSLGVLMADSHITRLFLRLHAMQTNTLSKFMPLDLHEKDTMNAEIYQVDFSGIFDDQGI